MGWYSRCVSCLFLLLLSVGGQAQVFDAGDPRFDGDQRDSTFFEQREMEADTFGIFLFEVSDPNNERPFTDSLLDGFQQYSPTRLPDFDLGDLGILGSPHYDLYYQPYRREGFQLGIRSYEAYFQRGDAFTFYRLQRPFTYLQYVQGSEQADGYIQAQFSRNFADGINFVLNYERIAQLGTLDQYPAQNLRNTDLGFGLWFRSKSDRYNGFLTVTAHTVERQENGGLRVLPNLESEFDIASSAQVFLQDTRRRHADRTGTYTHYLRFGGASDSTGISRRAFTLSHQIALNQSTYRLSGEAAIGDTAFYRRFPDLVTDERGFRNFTEYDYVKNTFRLSTFRLRRSAALGNATTQQDVLEVGLLQRYNRIRQEPSDSTVNNLLMLGKIGFTPNDRLRILIDGQLALLDQVGDYRISGELFFDIGAVGQLEVRAQNQLYTPALFFERYFLTQQLAWDRNFQKTLETNLTGTYRLPKLGIEVGGGYHLLTDYIYFDTTGLSEQSAEAVNIVQLWGAYTLRFGAFNLRNRLLLQSSNQDRLPLPELMGIHSLYYDGKWFRVLNVNLGVDLRYTNSYRAHYYNPITAQFQLQQRSEVPFVPSIDAFFSMRVTRFRAFFKLENAQTFINENDFFFLTADYPYPDAAFRIGISWRLLD